jgi:acetyl esterase/lipase
VFFVHGGASGDGDKATPPGLLDAKRAQARASAYGADPRRVVVIGHSAGAHLVALVATSPTIAKAAGILAPAGYVLLDTAALDVVSVVRSRQPRLDDRAFGRVPARWPEQSPFALLSGTGPPMLAVCSTKISATPRSTASSANRPRTPTPSMRSFAMA